MALSHVFVYPVCTNVCVYLFKGKAGGPLSC